MKKIYFFSILFSLICITCNLSGQTTFTYTGSLSTYSVPTGVTSIGILAVGAQGGSGSNTGGQGASIYGAFSVVPGHVLNIMVGQQPTGGSNTSGGGGGSFVWDVASTALPMVAAGGGGGGGLASATGANASITTTANAGLESSGGAGTSGNGGTVPSIAYYAGGGAGWLTNGNGGLGACSNAQGGGTPLSGGAGGLFGGSSGINGSGGYGGGGGSQGRCGAVGGGGGGGYSGGGAGGDNGGSGPYYSGGGGGSYNGGTAQVNSISTNTGNGFVVITVLCSTPGTITGTPPACLGSSSILSNAAAGGAGTWVSTNPAVATINASSGFITGVGLGTTVISYTETNPCGGVSALQSITVTINPLPATITGTLKACSGVTTTLSDTGTGTWVSTNTGVATVSPSGIVFGVAAGTSTISYTLNTGCAPATAVVTINANPAPITGTLSLCAGGATTALTETVTGGTFTSSTPAAATVNAGTGLVTSVGAGTTNITYTLTGGCAKTVTVTVNPLPAPISGTLAGVCVGGTTTLSDATGGGTWSSSNIAQASVDLASGVVSGYFVSTPTITYTIGGSGCKTSSPITVNPAAAGITGLATTCIGSSTSLSDASTGGSWSSNNTAVATVGAFSGLVSGISVGATTISYTLPTGCYATVAVPVNQLPAAYTMTGGGGYCPGGSGVHIGLSFGDAGISYQLFMGTTAMGSAVLGSSTSIDFGSFTIPGTYTVVATNGLTGCTANMTGSKTVSISLTPTMYDVTGGGGYCTGLTGPLVSTDGSDVGVHYQLFLGSTPVGTPITGAGPGINFGTFTTTGSYTVVGTSSVTGCSTTMNGNATIYLYPQPTPYTTSGNGNYCAGSAGAVIKLGGSDGGSHYQLVLGGTTHVGASLTSPGTGDTLTYPAQTTAGTYTVVATDGVYGCIATMPGSVTVAAQPLPVVYAATGGGNYCSGSPAPHIGLAYGSAGINYTLYNTVPTAIATVAGSGSSLDFGVVATPGTYHAVATNPATGCTSNMTGSPVVNINTPPGAFNVVGGGAYCLGDVGRDISLSGSETGIHYQLYKGSTAVGTYHTGTTGALDYGFITTPGVYTILATNPTSLCTTLMTGSATISVNPVPVSHTVIGGGHYCFDGTGEHIILNGSNAGVSYQLFLAGVPITGASMAGTGSALDYGALTDSGSYTVVATLSGTGCIANMAGSAHIAIDPLPNVFNVTGGGNYCPGTAGVHVGLDGSNTGIIYSLYNGSLAGSSAGTGAALDFGLRTTIGSYTVVATNALTGCVSNMNLAAPVAISPLPADQTLTGGGSYCAGGTGFDLTLLSSGSGVTYQLFDGTTAVGTLQTGGGSSVDFGTYTGAGSYRVFATDPATTCSTYMSSVVNINIVSPVVFTATGGGSFCAGAPGVHVRLSGSSANDAYTLLVGGVATGTPVNGTGSSLDFGLINTAGAYTVVANDTGLGCPTPMAGTATVVVNALPSVDSVTGAGNYCAGGLGRHIGLNASSTGILYQLNNGGVTTGLPVSGTGGSLDFGIKTIGAYSVVATDVSTGCTDTMANTALVNTTPLPTAYTVLATDSGYYCATGTGVHIYLNNSDGTINYQLFRGSLPIGTSVAGTGSAIDLGLQSVAGTYSVIGTSSTSACTGAMTNNIDVNIIPLPTVHNVTGGGGYCLAGGTGVHVGLDRSDAGIYYTLYRTGFGAVDSLYGINGPLDFGVYTALGDYTVIGNSQITYCPNNMFGTADVYIDTLMTPIVAIRAFPGTVGVWHVDSIDVSVTNGGTNPTYQWYVNSNLIPGATSASFTNHEFFNNDSVYCLVTASGPCGGLTTSKYVIIRLLGVGVAQVSSAASDVRLVPNPNKGTFNVTGNLGTAIDQEVTLEVTNMLGQVIYTGKTRTQNGSINEHIQLGSNLPNGMYILDLRSGTEKSVFHFVIEQ